MKKVTLTVMLLLMMMATNVFAATEETMEIVEDNVCTIKLNEDCSFEKKIVNSNLEKHQVTLQLKITNSSKVIVPTGELMLVIDSSQSMDEIVEGDTTRKDLVLNSANKLVEGLLEANPTSLKIGVVTFSSNSEKNDEGYFITGTDADAQKVCDFTNDLSLLTDKISSIKGTGQYTNLDAGLQLAKNQFSSNDTNKYLIVLTDGLPNLAVGNDDLVSYNGLTEIITQTKSTLNSLERTEVITVLTGINNEEANVRTDGTNFYTYGQVIREVFGTEEAPTKGKFYNIDDSEIEKTITDKVYHDLLPIEKSLEDIKIVDYIPQNIADNFDVTLNQDSIELSSIISDDNKTVTWDVDKLLPGESQILKFDLTLKNDFDEEIIDKILDTNVKVDINYKDFDGTDKSDSSDVTPKIRLNKVPEPQVTPEPQPEPPQDTTIAPEVIPDAGSPIFTFVFILAIVCSLFFGYKSFK